MFVKVCCLTLHWRGPGQLHRTLEAEPDVLGQTGVCAQVDVLSIHALRIGVPVLYHCSCSRASSSVKGGKGNSSRDGVKMSVQSIRAVGHPGASRARPRGDYPEGVSQGYIQVVQCVTVLFKCFALFKSLLCSGLLSSVV
jgi:hypothetical protein